MRWFTYQRTTGQQDPLQENSHSQQSGHLDSEDISFRQNNDAGVIVIIIELVNSLTLKTKM